MFKVTDKIRCINPSPTDGLYIDQIYTVWQCNPHFKLGDSPVFETIQVVEIASHCWWSCDRFILESTSPIKDSTLVVQNGAGLTAWLPAETTLDELMFGMNKAAYPQHIFKCECGVDSLGGGQHSDYCPKYTKA